MRWMFPCLGLVLVTYAAAGDGGDGVPAPDPAAPGYHGKMVAGHDPGVTYRLFVPEACADPAHAATLFPLLVMQDPGGRPDIRPYLDWARRHAVIVVGIDKVSNGMKQHEKPRYQRGVFRDLDAIGLRVHPRLRYTVGMSGGSADGERFTRHSPDAFAGILLQGAGAIPTDPKRRHLAVAALFGTLDDWVTVAKVQEVAATARGQGQAVRVTFYPRMGHQWAPMADQQAALTWLLRTTRPTNPFLTDDERAASRAAMLAEMEADAAIRDPRDRIAACRDWVIVAPLAEEPRWRAMARAYVEAMVEVASAQQTVEQRRQWMLDTVEGPPFEVGLLGPDELAPYTRLIASWEADAPVAEAAAWRGRMWQIRRDEIEAGRDVAALQRVIAAYDQVAAEAAGTPWAARAEQPAAALRAWIARNPEGGGIGR